MIIRSEEESFFRTLQDGNFFRTLQDGKGKFASMVNEVKASGKRVMDGKRVFVLYDTYGFPLELTRVLAENEGLGIDEEGFEREMELQRKRAQERRRGAGRNSLR